MQINKIKKEMTEILSDVFDGSTIMVGGFGEAGSPIELLHGLIDKGTKDLTIIANNSGNGRVGLGALIGQRQVKKVICSFARSAKGVTFPELYNKGEIELEVVPQGTLAERIRAAGSGIPGFYTSTGVGYSHLYTAEDEQDAVGYIKFYQKSHGDLQMVRVKK